MISKEARFRFSFPSYRYKFSMNNSIPLRESDFLLASCPLSPRHKVL